jgi:hypothetical protein
MRGKRELIELELLHQIMDIENINIPKYIDLEDDPNAQFKS